MALIVPLRWYRIYTLAVVIFQIHRKEAWFDQLIVHSSKFIHYKKDRIFTNMNYAKSSLWGKNSLGVTYEIYNFEPYCSRYHNAIIAGAI